MPVSRILLLAAGAAALLLSTACASQQPAASAPAVRVVFPPAPDEPVVEWTATWKKASDVGMSQSAFQKIVVGAEEVDRAFVAPTSVAFADDEKSLWVVDQRLDSVFFVSETRKAFDVFPGEGAGRITKANAVATSPDASLFVSDVAARAVYQFGANRRFVAAYGGPALFTRPTGLAVSSDGRRLAVCDTPAHKVVIFSVPGAKVLRTLGGKAAGVEPGEFNSPYALAFDEGGFLYVADYLNYRIQVFGPEGDLVSTFGKPGDRPGDIGRPRGIAVDSAAGVIFEVDGAFQVVQMFNLDSELLMWFGLPGDGPGQFSLPSGIARRGQALAVADTLNGRIQLFRFLGIPRKR